MFAFFKASHKTDARTGRQRAPWGNAAPRLLSRKFQSQLERAAGPISATNKSALRPLGATCSAMVSRTGRTVSQSDTVSRFLRSRRFAAASCHQSRGAYLIVRDSPDDND